MMHDVSRVVGWLFVMLAIFVFSVVMRDLLLFRAEYVEREKEREKLNARDE